MINIKALIKLYENEKARKTPFSNGYRPLFKFIETTLTSGQIKLIDREAFFPGDSGIVKITFLNQEYLGKDFKVGKKFQFYEGKEPLGEGEIISLCNENE